MSFIRQEVLELIKYFESFRANMYICPAGYKTIGYGHLIKKGENFNTISIAEAENLLFNDVMRIEKFIINNINVPLSIAQVNSLISFSFNVGNAAFQRSTLRQKINNKYFEEVPYEFRRWVKVKGKTLKGLVIRREAEIKMFYSDLK